MNYIKKIVVLILSMLLLFVITCGDPTKSDDDKLDPDYLLTDEELLTEEDPNAPYEDPSWSNWISNNNISIRSVTSENFSDLQALEPYLSNKRVIQLGESGHGVSSFNHVKTRLIKYLHEELGFNVIAFESSIFECFYSDQNATKLSSKAMMANSIFGVWHTSEVQDLFKYIKETKETNNPLILAGFDIQTSSQGVGQRPSFFRKVISKIDSDYANQIFSLETEYINNSGNMDYIENNIDSLLSKYTNLFNFFEENIDELLEEYADSTEIPLIAKQTAFSIPLFIKQRYQSRLTDDWTQSTLIRDKGMADNLIYLADYVYPDEKIIVWAHNYHIRHNNQMIPEYAELNTMGYWLLEYFGSTIYTIGLYMYRGEAAWNNRDIYTIEPSNSGSLESIFYRTRRKFCFLDLSQQLIQEGNSWIYEQITAKSWGAYDLRVIIHDQYNGILFIDTVSSPNYINVYKHRLLNKIHPINPYQFIFH